MPTVVLAEDFSDSSDSNDGYQYRGHNVYQQVDGPSAWWRRLTGQDPQYEPASVWDGRPRRRRRRRGRYMTPLRSSLGTSLDRGRRVVQLRDEESSDESIFLSSGRDEPLRGRRRYRTRSLSSTYQRVQSTTPRRYRTYSPSPTRYYPRSGYRHVPRRWYPWYRSRSEPRVDPYSEYYRPTPPPPELPRPAPPLPAPPMPPPNRTRPSQLRQERGDRYADSEEHRYREEYITLRHENIQEMNYEDEYRETMPDIRKTDFLYRDRIAREDRMEALQEILRGARAAAERNEDDIRRRFGVI